MGNRIQRTGTELKLEVIRRCSNELVKLPVASREGVVRALQEIIANEPRSVPEADPKQKELFS